MITGFEAARNEPLAGAEKEANKLLATDARPVNAALRAVSWAAAPMAGRCAKYQARYWRTW